jgi:16S rRNA C967 or C1407 C5-methylase (RsmB/RsmF family)
MLGEEHFERLMAALDEKPPVSIRLNPDKCAGLTLATEADHVPWCPEGYYLSSRPPFTFDPLLHAGCYYVQEASSMFITHVLRQLTCLPVAMLDLCAAPGGKTTAALTALPSGSRLWANEPVRQRAQVLSEHLQKWGAPACTVTCQQAHDFQRQEMLFDVVLCDVPCSGEGMFRKDPGAVEEWSPQNVEKCWRLQRKIVTDIWPCLKPGGLMVYSTCTLNTKENEENVRWICQEMGAKMLSVDIRPEWGILGSMLDGFDAPVYRFIPGFTRGEGLFMAAMRKTPPPTVELAYPQAVAYLQHQALQLPEGTPLGLVEVTFMGKRLGMVKNVGNRANNLYPQEWRIKSTHTPNDYEAILRHP